MKTKDELMNDFKKSCDRFWTVDYKTPIIEDISRLEGIKDWDRNKLDVGCIKGICVRVFKKENNTFYIMDLIIDSDSRYEITENEFKNLQKEYFKEYL